MKYILTSSSVVPGIGEMGWFHELYTICDQAAGGGDKAAPPFLQSNRVDWEVGCYEKFMNKIYYFGRPSKTRFSEFIGDKLMGNGPVSRSFIAKAKSLMPSAEDKEKKKGKKKRKGKKDNDDEDEQKDSKFMKGMDDMRIRIPQIHTAFNNLIEDVNKFASYRIDDKVRTEMSKHIEYANSVMKEYSDLVATKMERDKASIDSMKYVQYEVPLSQQLIIQQAMNPMVPVKEDVDGKKSASV